MKNTELSSDFNDLLQDDEELFIKNITLSTEFNKYIIEHPEIADKIPPNAAVVLLPDDDPEFCKKIIKLIDHHRAIDDFKNRPVVYLRVEKLA
ncbi:MAG: DUF5647 family protein, partial [bacterium]